MHGIIFYAWYYLLYIVLSSICGIILYTWYYLLTSHFLIVDRAMVGIQPHLNEEFSSHTLSDLYVFVLLYSIQTYVQEFNAVLDAVWDMCLGV